LFSSCYATSCCGCTRPGLGRLPPSVVFALADHTLQCDLSMYVSSASLLLSAKLK
jgi:hypothetical protein